jgi:hypothetical protein
MRAGSKRAGGRRDATAAESGAGRRTEGEEGRGHVCDHYGVGFSPLLFRPSVVACPPSFPAECAAVVTPSCTACAGRLNSNAVVAMALCFPHAWPAGKPQTAPQ